MKDLSRILALAVFFLFISTNHPLAQSQEVRDQRRVSDLTRLVKIGGVKFHQKMLQKIAEKYDNNRSAGSEGYEKSYQYVALWLWLAGYDVDIQEFEFPYFQELSDPELQITDPLTDPYLPNSPETFFTMTYSGSGEVEAALVPVDTVMPPGEAPNSNTSACEAADFSDFPAGAIALIQRGTCPFYDKAMNAQNAGAAAVIVYNEGQTGRTDAIAGTLGSPEFTIPVIFTSHEIGRTLYEMAQSGEVRVRISTDTISETRVTQNILASTKHGDAANTLMVGAHLDSAAEGPGINDNGSGAAAILETALKMGIWGIKPANKVVFAFWGAEELGLLGSEHFVSQLTPEELSQIGLYLNFDMIGSPNYVRFVYDGDGSDTAVAGPAGSEAIEQGFVDFFADRSLPTDPTELDGRSDYAPFMEAGIAIGGLFTGAGDLKTEEQEALYGGTAGQPYDANYHTPEDTLENINFKVEKQMLEAIAFAVGHYAENPLPEAGKLGLRAARAYSFDYRGPLAVR